MSEKTTQFEKHLASFGPSNDGDVYLNSRELTLVELTPTQQERRRQAFKALANVLAAAGPSRQASFPNDIIWDNLVRTFTGK